MIRFELKDLPYRASLEFICNCSNEELSKRIKKHKIIGVGELSSSVGGYTIVTDSTFGIIWVEKVDFTPEGLATLFHEVEHFRNHILRGSGIELNVETEEAYTYFGTELIEKILNRYNKEVKKETKNKINIGDILQ